MKFVWIVALCFFSAFSVRAYEYVVSSVDLPAAESLEIRVASAYRAIGHTAKFVKLPLTRRLKLLNDGAIDADLAARSELPENYRNVIQVGPALLTYELFLICPSNALCDETILDNPDIKIFSSEGGQLKIREHGSDASNRLLTHIDSPTQLVNMFNAHRLDYFIHTVVDEKPAMKKLHRPYASSSIGVYDLFHHVHKSNESIVKPLATALTDLSE